MENTKLRMALLKQRSIRLKLLKDSITSLSEENLGIPITDVPLLVYNPKTTQHNTTLLTAIIAPLQEEY